MVDQILVERFLADIRMNVKELREATDITWEIFQTDTRARRFVERTLHILIEACLDVAHHIIADEEFREPKNSRDAFTVLAEHNILPFNELETFHNMIAFRNLLVHYYERIDDEIVYGIFTRHLGDFDVFIEKIITYLRRNRE